MRLRILSKWGSEFEVNMKDVIELRKGDSIAKIYIIEEVKKKNK